MSFLNIPSALKQLPNWVCWKYLTKEGNPTKVPFDAKTGRPAKADDSTTWTTFEQASEAADILGGNDYEGIGFELGGTDIAGIDFDNAINANGEIDPYALSILALLGDPYSEKSPSGSGLHAFVECDALPAGKRKMSKNHEGVEIYHGKEGGRYFTFTCDKILGNIIPRIENIELPYQLLTQNKNKRFKALWLGDTSAYGNDNSNADFALMCELAKITQNDPVKMERFFSASALGRRDKWTDRADYRQRTIKAALDSRPKESTTNSQSSSRELVFHLSAVEGTHRDYVVSPASGQRDGWFPCGAVSLIAGPSGGTKTTWALQLLNAQVIKAFFYGHSTYGRPFLMIGADRGEDAHKRTMERMKLSLASVPFKPLSTVALDFEAVQAILAVIESTVPLPEIVFIEGIDMMVSENNSKKVPPFVHELNKIAQHYHIAIIGSLGSPKTQEGKGYSAARDNVIGSTAWGRTVETIALMQFPKGDDTSGKRKLTVMLRNAPPEKFFLKLQEGLLEIDPDSHEESFDDRAEQESREIEWYKTQARLAKKDPAKKWWTIVDMERALRVSHATADRHVKSDKQKGRLKQKTGNRRGRGLAAEYCWNESKSNSLWVEERAQEAEQMDVF